MSEAVVEKQVEVEAGDKFIFGCIYDQNVVLPDLITGPRGSEAALRFEPGQVIDLEEYFNPARLKRSRALKVALNNGWIIPCKTVDEVIQPKVRITQSGEAPINAFDIRLAEELDKEEAELERLKQGHDILGVRARRTKAQQAKETV